MNARLVDPFNFTKFDRTDAELEAMLLFSLLDANKRADQTYLKLEAFLRQASGDESPFDKVRFLITARRLGRALRRVRTGQYQRIGGAFRGVLDLNLRTCTVQDLEAVHGIGPKTARMFLLHSRPNQRLAVLDTHVLAYMHENGAPNVPESTPPAGPEYERLERWFLSHCDDRGITPAAFDLQVWTQRTRSRVLA